MKRRWPAAPIPAGEEPDKEGGPTGETQPK